MRNSLFGLDQVVIFVFVSVFLVFVAWSIPPSFVGSIDSIQYYRAFLLIYEVSYYRLNCEVICMFLTENNLFVFEAALSLDTMMAFVLCHRMKPNHWYVIEIFDRCHFIITTWQVGFLDVNNLRGWCKLEIMAESLCSAVLDWMLICWVEVKCEQISIDIWNLASHATRVAKERQFWKGWVSNS